MEPVERAGHAAERVADEVAPAHVAQLVDQHGAPAVGAPLVAFGGEHDGRGEEAGGERHLHVVAPEEPGRARRARGGRRSRRAAPATTGRRADARGRTMRRTDQAPHARWSASARATAAQTAARTVCGERSSGERVVTLGRGRERAYDRSVGRCRGAGGGAVRLTQTFGRHPPRSEGAKPQHQTGQPLPAAAPAAAAAPTPPPPAAPEARRAPRATRDAASPRRRAAGGATRRGPRRAGRSP